MTANLARVVEAYINPITIAASGSKARQLRKGLQEFRATPLKYLILWSKFTTECVPGTVIRDVANSVFLGRGNDRGFLGLRSIAHDLTVEGLVVQ